MNEIFRLITKNERNFSINHKNKKKVINPRVFSQYFKALVNLFEGGERGFKVCLTSFNKYRERKRVRARKN